MEEKKDGLQDNGISRASCTRRLVWYIRSGKQRHVLDIWVVLLFSKSISQGFRVVSRDPYRVVRDQMVNIMTTLPPPNAQPTTQVCNENANQRVNGQVVRDTSVTGVVRREHNLVPEKAQKACGRGIPGATEKEDEESEERSITKHFLAVFGESAVVETFLLQPLMQGLKLSLNDLLGISIKGRVFGQVCVDVILDLAGRVVTWGQSGLQESFVLRDRFLGMLESVRAGRSVQLYLVNLVMVELSEGTALYRRCEVHPCPFYPSDSVTLHAL